MVYERMVPSYKPKIADGVVVAVEYEPVRALLRTKRQYPDVKHHTIVLGPRYEGLLTDIFDRRKLSDDFSLYLHAPSRSDASMAPPGMDSFYVLSPVPNLLSGVEWADVADEYEAAILAELEARQLPGLRDNLVESFAVDPSSYFEGRLRSKDGAAFGPEPVLHQSAYFRYPQSQSAGRAVLRGGGNPPGGRRPRCVVLGQGIGPCRSAAVGVRAIAIGGSVSSVVANSKEVLAKHGRTFWLASHFLPRSRRDDAAVVYAFCRMVDDIVDEAEAGTPGATIDQALDEVARELAG